MLRDFQLMGWRGWEGGGVIELEEKREEVELMGEQSVLVQKAPGRVFTTERDGQSRMEAENTSMECWEFIFHEKLHIFPPAY